MTRESTVPMAEPLLDMEKLVAGIRWRRRIWLSCALLGLLAGVLFTVLFPAAPTAVTRVLVAHAEQGNRSSLMDTEAALCHTNEVAVEALRQLNVNMTTEALLGSYRCVASTSDVLQITVSAASDRDAVRFGQAVADAFIANHIRRAQDAVDTQAKALLDRRARLERTLATINNTIASAAPSQVDSLNNVRAGITSQILELNKQAEDVRIGTPGVIAGTRLVDPPRAASIQPLRAGMKNTAVGLVLGLGLGLALAAVLCVTQDRPILRRHIAAELGVSIIAQLPNAPQGPRKLWRRSRHLRERQRVAATLARVVHGAHAPISLLEIGCPGIAAALALDIAEHLDPERPVVIIADLSREFVNEAGRNSGSVARIVDVADLPAEPRSPDERPVLYLGVGSIGPGTSWVGHRRLGAETVLIVRAGQATTLGLHTIARQLAHAEISAIGVVLVAPDPRDRSDGTLWNGLHAALRQRQRNVAAVDSPTTDQPANGSTNGLAVAAAHDEEVGTS
jgi:hypothetical protein